MGNNKSKTIDVSKHESKIGSIGDASTSTGFHVVEFHFASAGIGMFVVVGVILALFALFVLWKRYHRNQRRQISRDLRGESSTRYSARRSPPPSFSSPPIYNPAFQFPPLAASFPYSSSSSPYMMPPPSSQYFMPPPSPQYLMPPMGFPPPASFPHPGITYAPTPASFPHPGITYASTPSRFSELPGSTPIRSSELPLPALPGQTSPDLTSDSGRLPLPPSAPSTEGAISLASNRLPISSLPESQSWRPNSLE